MDILLSIKSFIVFILILGIVIAIHEFGHFIAAKLVKARVEKFALGFGPAIWKKQVGETEYRLNWILLGGYCQITGEANDIDDPHSLSKKNPLQKVFVLIAGVTMNFLLACFIYTIYLAANNWSSYVPGSTNFNYLGAEISEVYIKPVIKVKENTAAANAGIITGSEFLLWKLNNIEVSGFNNFSDNLQNYCGQKVNITLLLPTSQSQVSYDVTLPEKDTTDDRCRIGFEFQQKAAQVSRIDYSNNKLTAGIAHTLNQAGLQIYSIGSLITQARDQNNLSPITDNVGSLVKIQEYTYKFLSTDNWLDILSLIGLINISLAFMNLLPILPLDGGHIVRVILQAIFRNLGKLFFGEKAKVTVDNFSEKAAQILATIGWIFFMLLFVVMIFKDIITSDFIQNLFKK